MIFYLFHAGCESNAHYAFFRRQPRVTKRLVKSDKTGELIPLYESPDSFLFNFCLYGTEKRAKFKIPLGAVVKVEMTQLELTDPP